MFSEKTSHAYIQSSVEIQKKIFFQKQQQQQKNSQAKKISIITSVIQMPVSESDMIESLYFNKINVSRFLDNFRVMITFHEVNDRCVIKILLLYYKINQQNQIKSIIK